MHRWYEIDQRAIKLLQLTFTFLCLVELWQRWPLKDLLYGPQSLLTPELWQRAQGIPVRLTLLSYISADWAVDLCFIVALGSALGIIYSLFKGSRSQFFWLALVICMMSLYGRCWIAETSAIFIQRSVSLFILLAVFSSNTRSLDWLSFGLRLQIAMIYLFNGIQKSGETWLSGEAIPLFLSQDRINTPLALWCLEHIPNLILNGLTWLTLALELILPFLIMSPSSANRLRLSAILCILILHGPMLFLVDLSTFPLTMIVLTPILLSSQHIEWLGKRIPNYARQLFETSICRNSVKNTFGFYFHTWLTVLLTSICLWGSLSDNPITRQVTPKIPKPLIYIRNSLDLKQWWSLYAPDVPKVDGWILIGLWTGSDWLDPRTGNTPQLMRHPGKERQWPDHLERITHELARPQLSILRPQLQSWFMRSNIRRGAIKAREAVQGGEVWWVGETEDTLKLSHVFSWGHLPQLECAVAPCWIESKKLY
jgi:hypothetical protein